MSTLEREAVLRAYRERVCQQADRLLSAELTVALGCSMLFRKSKAGKDKERKVERITDEATIRRYLDGELEHDPHDYYFIVTERPDTMTIRQMMDRTFDKPATPVNAKHDVTLRRSLEDILAETQPATALPQHGTVM